MCPIVRCCGTACVCFSSHGAQGAMRPCKSNSPSRKRSRHLTVAVAFPGQPSPKTARGSGRHDTTAGLYMYLVCDVVVSVRPFDSLHIPCLPSPPFRIFFCFSHVTLQICRVCRFSRYAALALRPGCKGFATDVCVPMSRLADMVAYAKTLITELNLVAPCVGHVGACPTTRKTIHSCQIPWLLTDMTRRRTLADCASRRRWQLSLLGSDRSIKAR